MQKKEYSEDMKEIVNKGIEKKNVNVLQALDQFLLAQLKNGINYIF